MKFNINNEHSIHSLRQQGWKIGVRHFRQDIHDSYWKPRKEMSSHTISPKGGITEINVTTPDGKHFSGKNTIPRDQAFVRKINNSIVLGKILRQIFSRKPKQVLSSETTLLVSKQEKILA